jgi:hypothetical protein
VALSSVFALGSAGAATITGITLSGCTPSAPGVCNATGPEIADSVGGNAIPNAYLYLTGPSGGFNSSGNTAASTALSLPLPTLGNASGEFLFQPDVSIPIDSTGAGTGYYEVNLFFDGNTTTPGVSLVTVGPSLCGGVCSFANAGTSYALSGALVAGSGASTYLDAGLLWTFTLYEPVLGCNGGDGALSGVCTAQHNDMVGAFNNVADGNTDYSFTVNAHSTPAPVPTPGSIWLLLSGLGLFFVAKFRALLVPM